jgi:hypothetical protein
MHPQTSACGLLLAAAVALPLAAYNPPTDTIGPLTLRIDAPQQITRTGAPVAVKLVVENSGAESLRGTLRVTVIDHWTVTPAALVTFDVPAKGTREYPFQVTAAAGSYNALYPIHAFADCAGKTAHAVLIVKTDFPDAPRAKPPIPWKPAQIAADSGFALWRTPVRRVVLQVFGKDTRTLPVGWEGVDALTHGTAQFGTTAKRGDSRSCITMHEPYAQGAGTILVDYPLILPRSTSIKLQFANAVRDDTPGQTPGDGVTFRVRVLPLDAPEGQQGEVVFERHTAAKTWQNAEADLSRFGGQIIRLQLESNPGPRNNTTNDSSFWAEPTLIAGNPPASSASTASPRTLAPGITVALGARGLLDATITLGKLSFHGFQVRVLGDALDDWRSPSVLTSVLAEFAGDRYRVRHSFRNWAGAFDLVGELWIEHGVLRAHWKLENAPAPQPWLAVYIESAGAGPWNQLARRVYAGDGNVMQDPAALSLSFDGHRLSTSYAGFDFTDGESLVEAVDIPPTSLEVDPKTHTYSLRAAHEQTMTFIPCNSAWTGVKLWRDINGLHPAGGVAKLAGRFVFDLWGGKFDTSAAELKRAFRYGLTDAAVVWHNWQRWGYDYRLPEIFPPNPRVGTTEGFASLSALCKKNGVLFAPHDNYIDFYPDAANFSYDQIAFNANGTPVKAWFNKGRDAQSYRWRADRLDPDVQSNIIAIRDAIAPTGYFIDVWSSAGPYDYWTRDGVFHSRMETRKVWGDTFSWIRKTLGDNSPTISESGHDQLIGSLDGAQTNHLRVDTPPPGEMGWTVWNFKVADAERIPWFDAAHHDRFILHGAGYENRYAGGLDTGMHGIYSDDYITTEVLDGHPAMVPVPFGRDVVRKYWLLHDLMRALALKRFESHEFAGGNLHRQHITWEGGGEVWVNRGSDDWTLDGHTLPQYGFYARVSGVEAAIERRDGVIVEWSRSPQSQYSNARPYVTDRVPLSVSVSKIDDLGDHKFRLTLNWKASGEIPDGYRIMVHFTDAAGEILFQGDHAGPASSGTWKGEFQTSTVVSVPAGIKPGQHFDMRVGLYSSNGPRARLLGSSDEGRRLRLASMDWTGGAVSWKPIETPADPFLTRFNLQGKPITFDGLTTTGAVRITKEASATQLTPLPGGGLFEIRLPRVPRTIESLNEAGEVIETKPGAAIITRDPKVFAYRLTP